MNKKFFNMPQFIKAYDNPATGGITINEVDAAIPEFWANVALGALKSNTVMAQLVNRDYSSEVATRGDVVNIIRRGDLVVNDKATGKQITLQTPSNSKIPVTLDKHKEISWLIEDTASAKAIQSAVDYVTDAAIALGEQIDRDLLALYSALNLQAGSATSSLNVDTILDAREQLNVAKAPVAGRYFVISPQDETALLKLEEFTKADWSDENQVALREATLGKKYGFTFIMDQQVATTAEGKQRHNIAFNKDAFALVTRPLPAPPAGSGALSSTLAVDGISVRVTRSYSQKDGGMLWTLDILYGIAGLQSTTHGVHVLTGVKE